MRVIELISVIAITGVIVSEQNRTCSLSMVCLIAYARIHVIRRQPSCSDTINIANRLKVRFAAHHVRVFRGDMANALCLTFERILSCLLIFRLQTGNRRTQVVP